VRPTLVENATRPRTHVEVPAEDQAEDEAPDEPACVVFSADHDARWIKKGRKSMLGYKGLPDAMNKGLWVKSIPRLLILVRAHSLEP
jgi:transposase, IS5 family